MMTKVSIKSDQQANYFSVLYLSHVQHFFLFLTKVEISEANRDEVAQELFILTQNSDDIGPRDITLSYEILQLIADLNSTDANVSIQFSCFAQE